MSKNKKQHYLPAFYIYNFTSEQQRAKSAGKERRKTDVFHYDIVKGEIKQRPIEKIATESYLLSYKEGGSKYNHELDEQIQRVETKAAASLQELVYIYGYLVKNKLASYPINNELIENVMDLLVWQIKRHPDLIADIDKECSSFLVDKGYDSYGSKKMALTVVKELGNIDGYDIREEFEKKNKRIIFTTNKEAHFITTDRPFVRFNKFGKNGIAVRGTEMYFPLTSNMLLFMCDNGTDKKMVLGNDRSLLRKLNTYIARRASKYLIGKSDIYLKRVLKEMANKPFEVDPKI
jgi:uncharacterized protein DUF4238